MKFNRSAFRFVVVVAIMLTLVSAFTVHAQDTSVPAEPITPEAALGILIAAAGTIAAGFVQTGLTTSVTGVLKMVFKDIDVAYLKNAVALVLTVGFWLATKYGFADQFKYIGDAMNVILPALVSLYSNFVASAHLHEAASAASAPLVGYKRKPGNQFN